jgi:GntR family transcriptional regulator, rspAB operon transcriptional repressor
LAASDSAAQQIQQALRRAIVTLELPLGAHLSENEVALCFGVSRQPAREAMIALAKLGLVHVVPQRGTVVVKISARQVMQVRFTRETLETAIVGPGPQPVRSDVPLQHRHDHGSATQGGPGQRHRRLSGA